MSSFVIAPDRILVSQIATVRSVYGDELRVFRPQLDNARNVYLKTYSRDGVATIVLNEHNGVVPSETGAFLHRENIAEVL